MRYIVPYDDKVRTIPLGRMGENEYTEIAFDIAEWQKHYAIDAVVLMIQRSEDAAAYPAVTTIEGNYAVHTLTSTDLAYTGSGKCQLIMRSGDVIAKSKVYSTICLCSLDDAEDPPEPWESWIEYFTELVEDAQEAARDAVEAKFGSLTVSASGLPSGSNPTASYDPDTNTLGFGIPKGDTGATGAPGQDGRDGADGAAATIAVGTVTTVPPGTPAQVENVGTSNAAVFNFSIPQGQTGTNDLLIVECDLLDNGDGTTFELTLITHNWEDVKQAVEIDGKQVVFYQPGEQYAFYPLIFWSAVTDPEPGEATYWCEILLGANVQGVVEIVDIHNDQTGDGTYRDVKQDKTDNSLTTTNKTVVGAINELNSGKMGNPMTAAGDIIIGGASGTPTRLARGSQGQYLGIGSGNTIGWRVVPDPTTAFSGSFSGGTLYLTDDTMQDVVDALPGKMVEIVDGDGASDYSHYYAIAWKITDGSDPSDPGYIKFSNLQNTIYEVNLYGIDLTASSASYGEVIGWSNKMNNPFSQVGDMVISGVGGVPSRLAKGTAGQFLRMNAGGTAPEWQTVPDANGVGF